MPTRIKGFQQAQVKNQDLASLESSKRSAGIRIEPEASQATCGDFRQPLIVIDYEDWTTQVAHVFHRGEVGQGLPHVLEQNLCWGHRAVDDRQLELGLQTGKGRSQAVQSRRQLRPA